ncbi:MAG: hypothetical protein K6V36_16495 [Anaerolineae bacterium]|nr:hypothetical protein [Anaerolineae bacterium]
MDPDVERIVQRTKRCWYDDGLAEMAGGLMFVCIGLVFLAQYALPSPGASGVAALGLPAVVIGGGLLARWLLRLAKDRLIYPRTGYVSYRRAGPRRLLASALAGATGGVLATVVPLATGSRDWLPALAGVLIGVAYAWLGYAVGVTRFYLLGAASAAIGLAVGWTHLGDLRGGAVYFGLQGLATILSGALALRSYWLKTRPAEDHGETGTA